MDRAAWDERYASSEYVWDVAPNRFVEAHLAGYPPGTAVDLAAGEGRNAVWLAERGWQVVAVDHSEVGLAKARRLADERRVGAAIALVCADVLDWEPTESVDLVLISYLQLPHDEQRLVLGRAAGWLRPGGTIFIVAHDRSNVADGYGGPSSEETCYDVGTTVEALPGLEIVSADVVRRDVDTPHGVRTALDTLVIARRPRA
jgi:SAM-dependent methyltransferase